MHVLNVLPWCAAVKIRAQRTKCGQFLVMCLRQVTKEAVIASESLSHVGQGVGGNATKKQHGGDKAMTETPGYKQAKGRTP